MEYNNADKGSLSQEEIIEKIAQFELNRNRDEDGQSEFEQKMERLMRTIEEEQYNLYEEINIDKSSKKR